VVAPVDHEEGSVAEEGEDDLAVAFGGANGGSVITHASDKTTPKCKNPPWAGLHGLLLAERAGPSE